jgi:hypothetical protein
MRRHGSGGGMPRLRAGLVTLLPGGLGPPSAPTTRGRLHWLDAARTKAGESLPDRGPSRAPSAPGSHGPGDRKAAVERREAPAFSKEDAARRKTGAPLGAPPPRFFGGTRKGPGARGRNDGVPGAAKNTGDEACAPAPLPLVGRGRGWGCWVGVVSDPTPTRFACRPSPQGGG